MAYVCNGGNPTVVSKFVIGDRDIEWKEVPFGSWCRGQGQLGVNAGIPIEKSTNCVICQKCCNTLVSTAV